MSESVSYYVGCPVIEMLYNSDHPIAKQIVYIYDLLGSKHYEKKYETIFTELKSLKSDINLNDAITIGGDSISRNLINWETEYVPNNDTALEDAITNLATDLTKICKGHSIYPAWYLYTPKALGKVAFRNMLSDTIIAPTAEELSPHVWESLSFEELVLILQDCYKDCYELVNGKISFTTFESNLSSLSSYDEWTTDFYNYRYLGTDNVMATKNIYSNSYTITQINGVPDNVFVFHIADIDIVYKTVRESFIKLQTIAKTTTNENLKSVLANLQPFIEDFLNLSITFQGTSNSYTTSIEEISEAITQCFDILTPIIEKLTVENTGEQPM
jgi:hypothetical protein